MSFTPELAKTLQLAIDAMLPIANCKPTYDERAAIEVSIAALRAALAAVEVEPVAHGELRIEHARSAARSGLQYCHAFDGKGIDWQSDKPWPHRIELAQALEWVEELASMVLNLADRVPAHPAVRAVEPEQRYVTSSAFIEACDLVDALNKAETNGARLALVGRYRNAVFAEALASTQPAIEPAEPVRVTLDERAWLIEHSGEMPGQQSARVTWIWVRPQDDGYGAQEFGHTLDASKALRFSRKEDAQAVLKMILGSSAGRPPDWFSKPYSVTEHIWQARALLGEPSKDHHADLPSACGKAVQGEAP